MAEQRFPAGAQPRVFITGCADLEITTWNADEILVETDDQIESIEQGSDGLVIHHVDGDLELRVPPGTLVTAEQISGDCAVRGTGDVSLDQVDGDVELVQIAGAVRLRDVGGDLEIRAAASVVLQGEVHGDVEVADTPTVEIEDIHGDLEVRNVRVLLTRLVGGDCDVDSINESLRYDQIGGDLTISNATGALVIVGSVGGDLEISSAGETQCGSIGGDAEVRGITGDLRLSNVGGDCDVTDVTGSVSVSNIGGDADLRGIGGYVQGGSIGGDLNLDAQFLQDSVTRLTIGGDATITLPDEPNLTVRATVGGDVSGPRIVANGGMFTAVYGSGTARLELMVGGDLSLRGGGAPNVSSSSSSWATFGEEMGRFGRELGEQFRQMGEQISREVSEAVGGWGDKPHKPHKHHKPHKLHRKHAERAEKMRRQVEERMRGVEERLRAAEERRAGKDGKRVRVRLHDREWSFDPERLERMKEQARLAAEEGVTGAMEAVERAIAGLGMAPPPPPRPPHGPPPPPPHPHHPPHPAAPPAPAEEQVPATGATINLAGQPVPTAPEGQNQADTTTRAADSAPSIEEERAAILQMVAEGRISPEEGDMLLDALGT